MAEQSYRVVDQQRDTAVNQSTGNVERGYRVYFTDAQTGVNDDVFVPDADYHEDAVRALIEHKLALTRAVHALGS
jgi:hypothetical protein